MNKRFLSFSLAILAFANSFYMIAQAADKNSMPTSNPSSAKKVWDSVKNNPKALTTAYGAGALTSVALGLTLTYKCLSTPSDYLYNKVSNGPKISITADTWFERLGGTQEDIDNYKQLATDYKCGNIRTDKKLGLQIEADVHRYPLYLPKLGGENSIKSFEDIFNRLLKIYFSKNPNASYTQGHDYILYTIYYKFMLSDRHYTVKSLTNEDEAKVYFIYTKFMKMLVNKFSNPRNWVEQSQYYCKQSGINIRAKDDMQSLNAILNCFMKGTFTCGACIFGTQELISKILNIWDCIITDEKFISQDTCDFNEDFTIDQLNKTIYLMLCEPSNNTLRAEINHGFAVDLINANTLYFHL